MTAATDGAGGEGMSWVGGNAKARVTRADGLLFAALA